MLGWLLSALIVVVGLGLLCLGLSGLTTPDPAGGMPRILAGVLGYFAVCAAMIVMTLRS
jgi:hypothetical protein